MNIPLPNKEDKGRLLFLTYLVMKIELDSMGDYPEPSDMLIVNMKHMMTLNILGKSIETDPDVCAELEPLATALILGCPDYALYANPTTALQMIANTGLDWLANNEVPDEWEKERMAFAERTSVWLVQIDKDAAEKIKAGESWSAKEVNKYFSEEFQAGLKEFTEGREEEGEPPISNLIQDAIQEGLASMRMEEMMGEMMANFDPNPEDIN